MFVACLLGHGVPGTARAAADPLTAKAGTQPVESGPAAIDSGSANPLLQSWDTPYGIPPFGEIRSEDFGPAFATAFAARREEIGHIRDQSRLPTFGNTVEALENAGSLLQRINRVFGSLANTDSNETLAALQVEITAALSRESDGVYHDPALFARVAAVHAQRESLELDAQQRRLLELQHRDFVRAGAALDADARTRLAHVNARLGELGAVFAQNVLKATKSFTLRVTDPADLAGLSPGSIAAARAAARAAGHPESWVFGLNRAVFEDFMTFADRRELRRRLLDAYRDRATEGVHDNRAILLEIVRLRAERAGLLGYASHADWELEKRMAGTPERARELLLTAWPAALARARQERAAMQAIAAEEDADITIEAWDWWYYAEKLRQRRYAIDEAQLKPWFELANVRRGAFYVAGRLFGLKFGSLADVPVWHPLVKAWAVRGPADEFLGVFMADDFARHSKRGGAWKSTLRVASSPGGEPIRPIVTNYLNLAPPGDGEPALLAYDQVETVFHEFGHALHELLSTVRYPSFSGSRGSPRDFTEFPSQFLERYAMEPEVLGVYARHHATGEVIPADRMARLRASARHNQGFRTTEFIAAALLDLAWHELDSAQAASIADPLAFERAILEELGLPREIGPRYRSTYFTHVFSSGYAAGYYGYLWSEVLEADAFEAFLEAGDPFDRELADRLRAHVYAAGGSEEAAVLYRNFRGRDPLVVPLLRKRGLLPVGAVNDTDP